MCRNRRRRKRSHNQSGAIISSVARIYACFINFGHVQRWQPLGTHQSNTGGHRLSVIGLPHADSRSSGALVHDKHGDCFCGLPGIWVAGRRNNATHHRHTRVHVASVVETTHRRSCYGCIVRCPKNLVVLAGAAENTTNDMVRTEARRNLVQKQIRNYHSRTQAPSFQCTWRFVLLVRQRAIENVVLGFRCGEFSVDGLHGEMETTNVHNDHVDDKMFRKNKKTKLSIQQWQMFMREKSQDGPLKRKRVGSMSENLAKNIVPWRLHNN